MRLAEKYKMIEVSFVSKDVNITKQVREDRIDKFRQDILAKYDLLFKGYPHMIKRVYN